MLFAARTRPRPLGAAQGADRRLAGAPARRAAPGIRAAPEGGAEPGPAAAPAAAAGGGAPPLLALRDPEPLAAGLPALLEAAPRVRVRRAADRAAEQLADLAVVNARLAAGGDARAAAAARQRVDFLRRDRRTWARVHESVAAADAADALGAADRAAARAEAALAPGAREAAGVGALRSELADLAGEVAAAHARLHVAEARVALGLRRAGELRAEAERLRAGLGAAAADGERAASLAASAAAAIVAAELAPPRPLPARRDPPAAAAAAAAAAGSAASRGLASSLDLEPGLRDHWFPVAFSSKLAADTLLPFDLFDEPWVLFRGAGGAAACVRDACAHRACPLSLGAVVDGQVACAYHGWRFDAGGECRVMPSTLFARGVRVEALRVAESDGLVWVFPGAGPAPPPPPPGAAAPPAGYTVHSEIEMEVPVEHGLLIENLLDLAHAPFTHTTTFARGWPVPELVQFRAGELLAGTWAPYPIAMAFAPPCAVLSTVGLESPGRIRAGADPADCARHLHQLHVALPSKRGHTRLLYRMSMDFMSWARIVPGIGRLWEGIAQQVLGEDLRLVAGQQERMARGADTWAHPVSYDKLAVRYRRWRNGAGAGAGAGAAEEPLSMTAAELFSLEEEGHSELEEDDSPPARF
jgi:chlorophyllide a oxygenase